MSVATQKKGVNIMTRSERKQARKQKQTTKFRITPEMDKNLWEIARIMTHLPSDKSKYGDILECGTGCYDYVGGKSYCMGCHYNRGNRGCHKMQIYRKKEIENG